MEFQNKATKKQPAKSVIPEKPRRVKNIIENDNYKIIRSPPRRYQKSSKRFKSSRLSSVHDKLALSPFEVLESWIDVVASSTPMVELIKLDSNDIKRIKGNSLLEESLSNKKPVEECSNHQPGGGSCNCKTCEDADKVAGKLFELTLSGDENEEVNGETVDLQNTEGQRNLLGRGQRRRNVISYKEDSLEDTEETSKGKRDLRKTRGQKSLPERVRRTRNDVNYREDSDSHESHDDIKEVNGVNRDLRLTKEHKNVPGRRLRKQKDVNNIDDDIKSRGKGKQQGKALKHSEGVESSSGSSSSFLESSGNSRGLWSDSSDTSGENARVSDSNRLDISKCSVTIEPLSKELQNLHLNSSVFDDKEEDKDLRHTRLRTRGQSKEEKSDDEQVLNTRKMRTRGKSKSESIEKGDKENDAGLLSTRIRTRGQSRTETREDEDEEDKEIPVRKMRTRAQSGGQSKEEDSDEEDKMQDGSRKAQTREQSDEEESSEDEMVSRMQTRGQSVEEEDEPMCPVTPRKKHLASFHTDSFKVCSLYIACLIRGSLSCLVNP